MLRVSCLALLLTSCLAACGESPSPEHVDTDSPAGYFQPADGTLHVRAIDPHQQPGVIETTPDVLRGSIDVATPGPGWVTLRLLAAPVPEDVRFLEPSPGVEVPFEAGARTRDLSMTGAGPHTCRVRWAFHVTSGRDLVKDRLEGLHPYVPKLLEPGENAELKRAWQENVLAEWWFSVGDERRSHWRGWSDDEWVVPRILKSGSRGSKLGMQGKIHSSISSFTTRAADEPIILGTWSWMWLDVTRGTQDYVDARKRWTFRKLHEDSSVELGDETFRPEASPFLTWRLVLQWTPEAEGQGPR